MAALTDGSWTAISEVTDIVPTEYIQPTIEGFNLPINIGNLIASVVPGRGYVPHQFAQWSEPTLPDPVRAGGATDTVLFMDFATTSSSLTPVKKGVGFLVPDELLPSTVLGTGVPIELLALAMKKIMEYKDLDTLDSVQAATQTLGSATTVPSFAQFRAYKNAFRDLDNDGMPIFVANGYFWNLMEAEFTTSTSTYSGRLEAAVYATGAKSAYRGNILGFDCWDSRNLAVESSASNNFMMTIGAGANRVIGQVAQQAITVEVTRGDTYAPRFTTQFIVGWADATGLLRADGLLECLSDAAP